MKVHWKCCVPFIISLAWAGLPNSALGQDPNAHFFLAHAAPGRNISSTTHPAYPVDISVASVCIVQQLNFGEVRGPYTFAPGPSAVKITVASANAPCGGTAIFTGSIVATAGNTSIGIVQLTASNRPVAGLQAVDLTTPVPVGYGRMMLINTSTTDNLTTVFTEGDSTGGTQLDKVSVPAGHFLNRYVTAGQRSLTVYPEGSTTAATGPIEADVVSRDVHIYVLAGSSSNNSVQVVGPIAIKDVL